MKKVGICVNDFGSSQLAYELISAINDFKKTNPYIDIMGFYENKSRPCIQPQFAMMHMTELWGYDGLTIATTLSTIDDLLKIPGPIGKYYYAWDLEWIHIVGKSSELIGGLYRNDKVQIIARTQEYAEEIEKVWNKKTIGVVNNFNIEELLRVTK